MGASWVSENILKKHPEADLRVYAIWVPAFPGDTPALWDRQTMPDARVRHFWDRSSAVGHALALGDLGMLVYDVYAVFGPDAKWGDAAVDQGGTVIGRADELRKAVEPLLG